MILFSIFPNLFQARNITTRVQREPVTQSYRQALLVVKVRSDTFHFIFFIFIDQYHEIANENYHWLVTVAHGFNYNVVITVLVVF